MKSAIVIIIALIVIALPVGGAAHSGRTDSSGGHNCNVGSCAGTYHYHNGGGYTAPPVYEPTTTTETVSEDEVVPFKSIEENNADLPVGEKKVTRAGVNGVKTTTYKITYSDGTQTSKDIVSSSITTQPIDEIIAIGTKQKVAAVSNTSPEDYKSETENASTGDTLGGFAILGAAGYGLFRWRKSRLNRINNT